MVIGKVAGQDTLEMPLMQDDHMIQALAPDTPSQRPPAEPVVADLTKRVP
jgi:hypothetical protein